MTDWTDLSRRAAFASHQLIGWIFWDPGGIERYAALGVPDGFGWYVASRAAPMAAAGPEAVTAAFGSIHGGFIAACLEQCEAHTTYEDVAAARDAAVAEGLRTFAPEICDDLGQLAEPLWAAADDLEPIGRVLFAAHRAQPRPTDDDALSAWLACNCIREWRGDTHWAIHLAEGLDGTAAGVLDNAWRGYPDGWIPRSRGADDPALTAAHAALAERGLSDGTRVTDAGIAYRQDLEDRLDRLTAGAWQHLGEEATTRFIELIEPVGDRLVRRVDETAGDLWMPAARRRSAPAT